MNSIIYIVGLVVVIGAVRARQRQISREGWTQCYDEVRRRFSRRIKSTWQPVQVSRLPAD
jgi:hypothetical protein